MTLPFDHRKRERSLSSDAFHAIRSVIHDFCGIYFEDNKQYLLESRVFLRMQAVRVRSTDEYLRLLHGDGEGGELSALVNAVTNNETYFFRHPAHLKLLAESIIPEIIRRKTEVGIPRVRIWSAACSSGDEAYSLAILVREKLQPRFPRAMIEIVATDIDTNVLQSARRARYSDYAVRNVPPEYLDRYFTLEDGRFILDRTVREMVRFKQLNLLDKGSMQRMNAFDIILCANVLIYFDVSARRHVLDLLHQSLDPGGYLFVGFSETLYGMSERFVPVRHDRSMFYIRNDEDAEPRHFDPRSRSETAIPYQSR